MVYTKSELEILLKQFVNLARKKIPIERIRLLLDFVHTTKMPKLVDVETLGYTPEEYEKPLRYGLLEEIKRKEKVIYEVRS